MVLKSMQPSTATTTRTTKRLSKMAKSILAVTVVGAVVFLSFQAYVYSEEPKDKRDVWGDDEQEIVAANNKFSLDLYKEFLKKSSGANVFFSPFSISTALTMTLLGARSNTAKEMIATLSFENTPPNTIHGAFKFLLRELVDRKDSHYILHLANKLYLQEKYFIKDTFKYETDKFYTAKSENVDFLSNTEGARTLINSWVEDMTAKRIKDLLKPEVLSAATRLVLVNAIYFKGDWKSKFDEKFTTKQDFYVTETEKVKVDMMYQKSKFMNGYDDEVGAWVLDLPYAGRDLSMTIILPKERSGLESVEKQITNEKLATISSKLRNTTIEVSLPKFGMTCDFNLVESLQNMGIKDLFSEIDADLSGINGNRELFVSHVIHKAFIEVNEEGSEAAAATAVVVNERMMAAPQNTFRADHPFLFYIRDGKTNSILFLGRVMKPDTNSTGYSKEDL